jgi:hypothetical protein
MTTTTNMDPLAAEIGCSLEHEPELHFFTWKVQVQNQKKIWLQIRLSL